MNALVWLGLTLCCASGSKPPADTLADHTFQLTDLRRLVRVTDPQISPDGRRIAILVSRPDWEKDESRPEIELVDVASGSLRPLTYRRKGLSHPRWSPDGDRLAFLARDSATDKSQLWVMRMDGGDPARITESKTGIAEYAWSPDGRTLAYVAQDTVPDPKAIEHHEDAFRVTDNNYMTRAAVQPWHLWLVPSEGGAARRLTSGSWSLNTDQGAVDPPAWSPDGSSIVFTRFPDVWLGNTYRSILARVDAAPGASDTAGASDTTGAKLSWVLGPPDTAPLRIGSGPDSLLTGEGAGRAAFAPAGGALAFRRPRGGDLNNGNAVFVIERDGTVRDATADLARNINGFAWLPDGDALLLTGDAGTRSVMWRQPLDGAAERLELGDVQPSRGLSVSDDGAVAFVGSTPRRPAELYLLSEPGATPRRLTDLNAFVDSLRLGRVDTVAWTGPGGFREDGVLTYPPDYEPGTRLPLVLVIHGGPEGASTTGFSPLPQLLAAHGYLVFQPNYRGSINLGDRYQHAIFRDTGEGPGRDVMAGLAAVEELGIVDTSRIAVSGWSYGGYMTAWLTSHYDRWKAAVAGAALTDWLMDYTIAFYQKLDLYFFGGSPWTKEHWQIWRDQSPIQFAASVTAPTLILGDAGDPNVPIVNSYEWYHALRDNGVETEFYVYPADSHFPRHIVRMTDVYRRWIEWLDRHLR